MQLKQRKQIINMLKADSRVHLTMISKKTGVPVSSLFDFIRCLRKDWHFTIKPKDNAVACPDCGSQNYIWTKHDDILRCKQCSNEWHATRYGADNEPPSPSEGLGKRRVI